jgi:hypothetical protein
MFGDSHMAQSRYPGRTESTVPEAATCQRWRVCDLDAAGFGFKLKA